LCTSSLLYIGHRPFTEGKATKRVVDHPPYLVR